MTRLNQFMVIAALFILCMIYIGMHYSFGVFFNPLMTEFRWSKTTTSSIFSLYMFLYTFFQWFMGGLTDRYPYYRVIGLSMFVYSASLILISMTTSLWQLYLSYSVLSALGLGGTFVPAITVVNKVFKDKRGLVLGAVTMGAGFGMLMISLVARFIIDRFSWRTSYFVFGVAGLLTAILVTFVLKKAFTDPNIKEPDIHTQHESIPARNLEDWSLKEAVGTVQLWMIAVAHFLFMTTSSMLVVHLVPYALDLKLSAMGAALGLGLVGVGRIFGSVSIGWLSDKITRKRSIIICAFGLGLIMLSLPGMNSLWYLYTVSFVFGIFYAGGVITFIAIPTDFFGKQSAGSIFGFVNLGYGLGSMAGPVLGGMVFDYYGSYSMAFYLGLAISIATVILVNRFFNKPERTKIT